MKNSQKNLFILILVFAFSIVSTTALFFYFQSRNYSKEIYSSKKENDSIQKRILNKNAELIVLLKKAQSEKDSLDGKGSKNIDGIIHYGKPITLEKLVEITNSYENQNMLLKDKVYNDSLKIERINKILNLLEKDKVINREKKGSISYRQVTKLDSLYESSIEELNQIKTEIKAKNSLLSLIKKNYEIDTKIEYKKDSYIITLLNTKKLDSALLLFPYYKHKIKTNKQGETVIK
ncbi:hypothetical protein AR687_10825 [Flavobacteriaceae bacterium CRH]|nr:hypothetical protein AR687_10825 [Flavobacteriaceae bacterium CRH]